MIRTAVPGDSAKSLVCPAAISPTTGRCTGWSSEARRRRRRSRRRSRPSRSCRSAAGPSARRCPRTTGRPSASSSGWSYGGSGSSDSRIRSTCSSTVLSRSVGMRVGSHAPSRRSAESAVPDSTRPRVAVERRRSPTTVTSAPKVQSPSTTSTRPPAATARPRGSARRSRRPACRRRVQVDERHRSARPGRARGRLAEVVDVGAQHQQVVGGLHRQEPVAGRPRSAGRPRRPRSRRPSRSRSGSPRGSTGRPGRRSWRCGSAAGRACRRGRSSSSRSASRSNQRLLVEAEPVPVQVGERVVVLGERSARSRAARSGRPPCGRAKWPPLRSDGVRRTASIANGAPDCGEPAGDPRRRGPRRGCRSWRRTPAVAGVDAAGRAGRCRAARCRGRRARAGTTRGPGRPASVTGVRSSARSLGSLFCRKSSGSPSTAQVVVAGRAPPSVSSRGAEAVHEDQRQPRAVLARAGASTCRAMMSRKRQPVAHARAATWPGPCPSRCRARR